VIKYGMTRGLVLGLDVVMADGSVISSMKKIIKDNSGYDLKQMFIGSEGTLGIVTKALFKLEELPTSRNSAFIGFEDFGKIVKFLKSANKKLAGNLSGFEILWKDTYRTLTSEVARQKAPLPDNYDYYILMETLGGDAKQDKESLQELLQEATQKQIILDAVMSHSDSDCDWFWSIRENVDVMNSTARYQQSFDISLPIGSIDSYVKQVRASLLRELNLHICYAFGHLGDGNIHFVVGKETNDKELREQINNIVYRPLKDLQGSVSAEHGIGIDKKRWLGISRSQEEIALMKTLKQALDPKGILNPGRVVDRFS
ncbi:MAG: FAD-binding oxidoreductase, partial [Aurantibacter sp.]